ncbi:MAG: hypothetical protein LBK41_05095 [Clostridiales bacterium]|jgi:hypothetical protein|nr:hypothetical protein [Clostridiales bacterium]
MDFACTKQKCFFRHPASVQASGISSRNLQRSPCLPIALIAAAAITAGSCAVGPSVVDLSPPVLRIDRWKHLVEQPRSGRFAFSRVATDFRVTEV